MNGDPEFRTRTLTACDRSAARDALEAEWSWRKAASDLFDHHAEHIRRIEALEARMAEWGEDIDRLERAIRRAGQ